MGEAQYRKNVAIIVTNVHHHILLGHRREGGDGAWQLPQGGIQADETPEQALQRELKEETGLMTYEVLGRTPTWIRYDWPDSLREGRPYLGQEQLYFVIHVSESDLNHLAVSDEFDAFCWVSTWQEVVERVIEFKKASYTAAYKYLKAYF